MPIIKSAKKKLRQDKVRTLRNNVVEKRYKELVKKAVKSPSKKTLELAVSATDKAVKYNLIHKNKASRVKRNLSKLNVSKTLAKSATPKHQTA